MEPSSPTYDIGSLQQDLRDDFPSWDFAQECFGSLEEYMDIAPAQALVAGGINVAEAVGFIDRPAGEGPSSSSVEEAPSSSSPAGDDPPSRQAPKSQDRRRQAQNRHAQQRLRQRQKSQLEEAEAQLLTMSSKVAELQECQRQLEARNAALEVLARAPDVAEPAEPAENRSNWETTLLAAFGRDPAHTHTITVLDGPDLVETYQSIGQMPFTQFATLHSAYANKVGQCMMDFTADNTGLALPMLHKWLTESYALRIYLAVGNFKNYVSYTTSRLDGVVGPPASQLSDAWYEETMTALQLTEAQQVDLMHLRRLFYARLGALARERKQLLQQLPVTGASTSAPEASSRLADVRTIAQQLQDNSCLEFRMYLQLTSASRRGVFTLMQQAICVVQPYPYIPDVFRSFEALAAMRGEPSTTTLTQPGPLDDLTHAANWQQVQNYLKTVTHENLHIHVPFIQSQALGAWIEGSTLFNLP